MLILDLDFKKMKNIILYIIAILAGWLLKLVALIIYPITFLLRYKIVSYAKSKFWEDFDNKRFVIFSYPYVQRWKLYLHPYFWLFCLTTGFPTDYYWGPEWYKKKLKDKWFGGTGMEIIINLNPSSIKFKDKLRYFYICYGWQGVRNSTWAFSEWFLREGGIIEGTLKTVKTNVDIPLDIMPEAKWDEEGNDGGTYLRYPYDAKDANDIWRTTHEGKKTVEFLTGKGNKRFYWGYCKILRLDLIRKFLVIEYLFGWNWFNGMPSFHFKHMLRKMDIKSLTDYLKYQEYLKE